jgi:prepilin peptidase CpaA
MPMLLTFLLLVPMLIAAATDVARHKIHNWTTYPGILTAFAFHALGALLAWRGVGEQRLASLGFIPISESLFGFAACGAVMLFSFALFRVGGGDVKLMAMVGAFAGPWPGVMVMLWTFVLGGCMGLCVLIWRVGLWRLSTRTFQQLMWSLRLGHWEPLSDADRAELQPPLFLAPCALAGVIIVQFRLIEMLH